MFSKEDVLKIRKLVN